MNSVERDAVIKKLGEASYSEVFLQTPTDCEQDPIVLKIIPFGKEEQCEISQIIQEVRITKAMGEIEGYIGFRGAYVTRGFFPNILIDEWDLYDEEYGSENERPDFYDEDQLFAIIMLEMGGSDLEHTDLNGWEDAFDVFFQTAVALARGEKRRQFEHRDLHFGNIVIRRKPQALPTRKKPRTPTSGESDPSALLENLSLNTPSAPRESNLKVAMIDYTLSRAHCGPSSNTSEFIEFAPLDDPALFTGKGNYQFDIYRFMKNHVTSLAPCAPDGSDGSEESIEWNVFAPMTNVFWLHYLTDILMNKKGIPRPAARGRFKTSEEERDFYRKVETVGRRINPRKKMLDPGKEIGSAVELVEWAVKEGLFPEVEI
ncbi:hypothetical protein EX30DRAFT_306952 [Ascodesmis nigricans]|uniref:non-specific serine/threonine protein kinase n=1 Tax=Ascodesmis nigricans TaxID=341454 RepID=A0A4S2MWH9_9PEZI|nr:hypothetical protein EX30DRAFT_306952 [Ascodesmis nigricans]